jgi:hypothetical protein
MTVYRILALGRDLTHNGIDASIFLTMFPTFTDNGQGCMIAACYESVEA